MDRNSWGVSLFCDDIRAELGGKISVMGIYQTDMIFPEGPPLHLAEIRYIGEILRIAGCLH
jgi:hypothetical protein